MTNIAFNTNISSMLKIRYAFILSILPFSSMFSSFGVMWILSVWLDLDTETPIRETGNALLIGGAFIGFMIVMMLSFYLLGWLLNAIISLTVLGWDKNKVKNVYLRSQVPDSWLKGEQNLESAMITKMESWRGKREAGTFFYVLRTGVLSWGLIMYLAMAVLPAVRSPEPLEVTSLLWQAGVWAMGGALFGYLSWYFSEKQYLKYLVETPEFETANKSKSTSLGQNQKLSVLTTLSAIGGVMLSYWAMNVLLGDDNKTTAEMLTATAKKLNEHLPIVLDEETTWIASSSLGDSFTYTYRLPNYNLENIDVIAFVDIMTPNIKTSVCNGEPMKAFRELNAIVIYDYVDSNNKLITQIKVDTKSCG